MTRERSFIGWQDRGRSRRKTGAASLKGARILIVEARYYDDIADMLLSGVKRVLDEAGASHDVITVPGALEIPTALAIALDAAAVRNVSPMTAPSRLVA